jgi:hypothetical protein
VKKLDPNPIEYDLEQKMHAIPKTVLKKAYTQEFLLWNSRILPLKEPNEQD